MNTSHPQPEGGETNLTSWNTSLASLSAARSHLVSSAESQVHQLNEWTSSIPSAEEVNQDAKRLDDIFNPTHCDQDKTRKAAQEISYQEKLVRLCEMLDNGVAVDDLLETSAHPVNREISGSDDAVDVKGVLERAWSLDHESMLVAKSKILDNVCTSRSFHGQITDAQHLSRH
jgi:hypothetical protein